MLGSHSSRKTGVRPGRASGAAIRERVCDVDASSPDQYRPQCRLSRRAPHIAPTAQPCAAKSPDPTESALALPSFDIRPRVFETRPIDPWVRPSVGYRTDNARCPRMVPVTIRIWGAESMPRFRRNSRGKKIPNSRGLAAGTNSRRSIKLKASTPTSSSSGV